MSVEEKKRYAELFLEVIQTRDFSVFDEIIHPDYSPFYATMASTTRHMVNEVDALTKQRIGVEGLIERIKLFYQIWKDTHIKIIDIVAEGNTVIAYYLMTYTHHGNLLGIKATNKRVSAYAYHQFKFKDGKIIQAHMLQDFFNVIKQVGLDVYSSEQELIREYLEAIRKQFPFDLT